MCKYGLQVGLWQKSLCSNYQSYTLAEEMSVTLKIGVSNQFRFLMAEQSLERRGAPFTLLLHSLAVVKLKYKGCLLAVNKRTQKQRDFQGPGELRQKPRSPRKRFILPAERPESGSLVFISPHSFSIPRRSPHTARERERERRLWQS